VRKKAREDGKDDGQDVEVEDLAQGAEGAMKPRKKARVRLPWDVSNMFPEAIPEGDSDEDEEAVEANAADLERLKVVPMLSRSNPLERRRPNESHDKRRVCSLFRMSTGILYLSQIEAIS